MTDDSSDGRRDPAYAITSSRSAYFLLARPTEHVDELPATIGERDVFFTEDAALDALDVHYAWCAAQHGGHHSAVVAGAHWYLQSATIGSQVAAGLGEVFLATAANDPGRPLAVAGGFLTEGELIHWTSFVRAAMPYMAVPSTTTFELVYRGDESVDFDRITFAPSHSRRVYPKRIVVSDDDA
ncbi:hypothetical protein GTV32_17920 [Gordonia sp. SID5947]|uniref:hypothetical protein n=1 Tax=Gordonia sp. SID5947 TaxID=2690315 RepID=UPI00136B1E22|nr:hypothetical protein [Gordonia sp. SID5947]MYR08062.1 hypothetical protein [Gordonia sp. SID5947]